MIWDTGDRGVFLCLTVRHCDACGQDAPHVQTDVAVRCLACSHKEAVNAATN